VERVKYTSFTKVYKLIWIGNMISFTKETKVFFLDFTFCLIIKWVDKKWIRVLRS